VGGSDLTDGVADQVVGADAPRLQQAVQRDRHSEQPGAREHGLVDQILVVAPDHPPQRQVERLVQFGGGRVEGIGEHLVLGVQLTAHAQSLSALAGEHEGGLARSLPTDDAVPGRTIGEHAQATQQLRLVTAEDSGPVLERCPGSGQRVRDIGGVQVLDMRQQAARLCGKGLRGLGRDHPRHDGLRRLAGDHGDNRRLFDDHVSVRPAQPERRNTRSPRTAVGHPRLGRRQQPDIPSGPVDLGRRRVDVHCPRQRLVPHRLNHLDDPGGTGCGLGVADVRLHRPQPQRRGPVVPIGFDDRLRLDRIAEAGPCAVSLDDVDVGGRQSGTGHGLADDPLLCGAVRPGQAVRGTIGVDRRTTDDRQYWMSVTACIRHAFE
jgi:hypothetical protein